jgi:hypothetical protein
LRSDGELEGFGVFGEKKKEVRMIKIKEVN